jgi:thioredoxin-related protein
LKSFLFTLLTLILFYSITLQARDINIDHYIDQASKENKHLFVFLHRTDCGYCDSMLEFTFDDDIVSPLLEKHFKFVHINIFEKDSVTYKSFTGNGREFARHVKYNIYPSSLFFDANKELIFAVAGYRDEKVFANMLNYVQSRSYLIQSFEKYEANHEN